MKKQKLTYVIIFFIGIFLLLKGIVIGISNYEIIKYGYSFEIDLSLLMTLLHRGLFVEVLVIIISFIGLFIKKRFGYILLLIFPAFSIALFFLLNKSFTNNEWGLLIIPILIISLSNIRVVLQYFQINTMNSLWRSLSLSSVIGLLIALIFNLIMK